MMIRAERRVEPGRKRLALLLAKALLGALAGSLIGWSVPVHAEVEIPLAAVTDAATILYLPG